MARRAIPFLLNVLDMLPDQEDQNPLLAAAASITLYQRVSIFPVSGRVSSPDFTLVSRYIWYVTRLQILFPSPLSVVVSTPFFWLSMLFSVYKFTQ